MATAKGHLDQERKNLQSTKLQRKSDDSDSDHFPKYDKLNKKTHQAAAHLFLLNSTSKAYGDITDRLMRFFVELIMLREMVRIAIIELYLEFSRL